MKRLLLTVWWIPTLLVVSWYAYQRMQPTSFYLPESVQKSIDAQDVLEPNEADAYWGYGQLDFTSDGKAFKNAHTWCVVQYHWKSYRELFYPLPSTLAFKDWCEHQLVGPTIGSNTIAEKQP